MVTTEKNLQEEEEDHHGRVFIDSGYPKAFIHLSSLQLPKESRKRRKKENPFVGFPYLAGLSEYIRVSRRLNIRIVFKSGQKLSTWLIRVKEELPSRMHSCVVYCIPCSCGKVYTGKTSKGAGDKSEGALGCMQEGDDREVIQPSGKTPICLAILAGR